MKISQTDLSFHLEIIVLFCIEMILTEYIGTCKMRKE